MNLTDRDVTRFTSKFKGQKQGGCFEWSGGSDGNGYGAFSVSGISYGAHRVAFYLANGFEPEVVRHRCDNPKCVNPKHLVAGTHKDNVADRVARQRSASGMRNGRAKLTPFEVVGVREDLTTPPSVLADILGVDPKTIRKIREGSVWSGVTTETLQEYLASS